MEESTLTTSKPRIDTIDVLRGFALAGILYAHMVIWYTGAALPPEVYSKYSSIADGIAMGIFGSLVFGKFFSIFSFLFGISFFLHFRKNRSTAKYIWRLILLFVIGLAHHIFWRGDILAIYAILGMTLMLFRNLSPRLLLWISLLLILDIPTHVYDAFDSEIPNAEVNFPMAGEAERYYRLVQNGDFFNVLKENWNSWPEKIKYQLESGRLLMTFGYFLLGLYAGRTGLFTSIEENISKFRNWNRYSGKAVLFLLSLGLLMYLFNLVTLPDLRIVPELKWTASFLFSIYNACLTIFYITGITLGFRMGILRSILQPLAAMGRMALTNYLLQTFFGLLLFYNFGLGLFDRTSPAINVLLGVFVFYLQLKFSQWWLQRYKQGPVEWLWRGATYFQFSSINKKGKEKG